VRVAPWRTGPEFNLEAVREVLEQVGWCTDLFSRQREGHVTCVFATMGTQAQYDDVMKLPWGRRGQLRLWPEWTVERAQAPMTAARRAQQLADGHLITIEVAATPGPGPWQRLEWTDVARALRKHRVPRCFVRVHGHGRTRTVSLDAPVHAEQKVHKLFSDNDVRCRARGGGQWQLRAAKR
jgi:hypothetical protein